MTSLHQNKGGSDQDHDIIPLVQVGGCAKIGLFLVMLVIISLGVFQYKNWNTKSIETQIKNLSIWIKEVLINK